MQRTQLDPRARSVGWIPEILCPTGSPPHTALLDLQREHKEFLRRAMTGVRSDYTILDAETAAPNPQDFDAEARAARLAAENDRLRLDQALLQAQLSARDAELAAKNAEITDLRWRLASVTDEIEIEALPHRRLSGAIRARTTLGSVRGGSPFIHPDDLEVEDE